MGKALTGERKKVADAQRRLYLCKQLLKGGEYARWTRIVLEVEAAQAELDMAHAIKALLSHYDAAFHQKFGFRYPINRGKDAALAKRLLGLYTPEQLQAWIDHFFEMDDAFIQQSGYSFGVFSACLGKVIVMSTDQREKKRRQGSTWIQRVMKDREPREP